MAKASQDVILENEFYIIKAPNGKVLEVKDFNTENGAAIQLWSYAGHPWQQWQFVDAGGGRWRIQNRFTGKVIDLALGGVVEGTWLHQWSRTNGWSQCWTLEPTRIDPDAAQAAKRAEEKPDPQPTPSQRKHQNDLVRKLNNAGQGRASRKD